MGTEKRKPGRPPGSKNKKNQVQVNEVDYRVKDDIWGIVLLALGAFLVLALQTNVAGEAGAVLSNLFKGSFGAIAYVFPYYIALYGILLLFRKVTRISGRSVFFLSMIFLMLTLLNSARFLQGKITGYGLTVLSGYYNSGIKLNSGGAFGMYVGSLLVKAFGVPGLCIFAFVIILICLILVMNTPISRMIELAAERRKIRKEGVFRDETPNETPFLESKETKKAKKTAKQPPEEPALARDPYATSYVPGKISKGQRNILNYVKDDDLFNDEDREPSLGLCDAQEGDSQGYGIDPPLGLEEVRPSDPVDKPRNKKKGKALSKNETFPKDELITNPASAGDYIFPPIELLHPAVQTKSRSNLGALKSKAVKLEETLQNFGIDARVINFIQGPAVTRYEIQPNVGVKVKSITNLADDIALNLEAKSIRMEAPIPGKAAVGIEVENDKVTMVSLREIIDSREFKTPASKLTFVVGKDISGHSIVADLKAMPHLLIAGSTGSGKSVCINCIITSILYKATPEEVKLVLIDPKVVELSDYNGIPHLLIPVVTEPGKAAAALSWAVAEMDERYKKFAQEGVRELDGYNKRVKRNKEEEKAMPQIVIIIDELADLMMAAPAQVEESICRLAQKARAAGMHLIVATQRPSVDVITGVIKANIPSRIAFAVSSQFDSRTILDMAGAEKLVGKGDMLYSPLGDNKPTRIQGAFIDPETEVTNVIDFVKEQGKETEYSHDVMNTIEKANLPGANITKDDSLLQDAIETVVSAGQVSVNMLQRRFRLGYNRAANLMDMMEARGIVGPSEGTKPRQVLMTETEYHLRNQNSEEPEDES